MNPTNTRPITGENPKTPQMRGFHRVDDAGLEPATSALSRRAGPDSGSQLTLWSALWAKGFRSIGALRLEPIRAAVCERGVRRMCAGCTEWLDRILLLAAVFCP